MVVRISIVVALLASLLSGQESEAGSGPGSQDEVLVLESGKPLDITMKVGETRRLRYVAQVTGEAVLWARSRQLDPDLEVRDARGERLGGDEDSGGAGAALLLLDAAPGRQLTVVVRAGARRGRDGAASGAETLRVNLIEVAIGERLEGRFAAIRNAEAAVRAKRQEGRAEEALGIARSLFDSGLPSVEDCTPEIAVVLYRVGMECFEAGNATLANRFLEVALEAQERLLPEEHPSLQLVRDASVEPLWDANEKAAAVALQEKVLNAFAADRGENDVVVSLTRMNFASMLSEVGDERRARVIGEEALAGLEAVLPDTHPDLVLARCNHAVLLRRLEDYVGVRALEEKLIAHFEATLPTEHALLLEQQRLHALTLARLGEAEPARSLAERVVGVCERTLPVEHEDLRQARLTLVSILKDTGALVAARHVEERLLAVAERSLPEDHSDLRSILNNHGNTLMLLGEFEAARALLDRSLRLHERALPAEHPELLQCRSSVASSFLVARDFTEARRQLERVLEIQERILGEDDSRLQSTRTNLASALLGLGDLEGARALQERVLEVRSRTLHEAHADLQVIRGNYAVTLYQLGDLPGARALLERVLDARGSLAPEDNSGLLTTRQNYACILKEMGEFDGARKIERSVLDIAERVRHPDDPRLQSIRMNYAATLVHLGRLEEAHTLSRKVVEIEERALPEDHPRLQETRMIHAFVLRELGDLAAAREILEKCLVVSERALPADHPDLQRIRASNATVLFQLAARGDEAAGSALEEHLGRIVVQARKGCRTMAATLSRRQAALRVAQVMGVVDCVLSFGRDDAEHGGHAAGLLLLIEELRTAGLRERRLAALAGATAGERAERIAAARREIVRCEALLEELIAGHDAGTASSAGASARLAEIVQRRERAEREMTAELRGAPGAERLLRTADLEDLAGALPAESWGVSYCSYERWSVAEPVEQRMPLRSERHLVAFLLSREGRAIRVELGPLAAVTDEIGRWRALLGAPLERGLEVDDGDPEAALRTSGEALRRLLVDPLLAFTGATPRRLVVALADELHLVPLDALPFDDGARVGDRLAIELVASLSESVTGLGPVEGPPRLLALGDVDFLGAPRALNEAERALLSDRGGADLERGSPFRSREFRELPFTETEVRAIGKSFERAFDDEDAEQAYEPPVILSGRRADKRRLMAHAPAARFVHLATHGWFAPDSVASVNDRDGVNSGSLVMRQAFGEQVKGYAPMALCGLALAGANLEPDAAGRHPGLLSGTEIASMDLSGCELAVLSACETNVGIRRAGQGIASLQEALFMAGARSSITSLWKVPDEATMELMTRFYEGIWRRGETKREALWAAKKKLRDAMDPSTGRARYGLRDWAGWVLVGMPE